MIPICFYIVTRRRRNTKKDFTPSKTGSTTRLTSTYLPVQSDIYSPNDHVLKLSRYVTRNKSYNLTRRVNFLHFFFHPVGSRRRERVRNASFDSLSPFSCSSSPQYTSFGNLTRIKKKAILPYLRRSKAVRRLISRFIYNLIHERTRRTTIRITFACTYVNTLTTISRFRRRTLRSYLEDK